jgi:hypothetical protein
MVDIDLVMMDREFDSEPVKDTCEEYGVHYVNPTRIFTNSDEAERECPEKRDSVELPSTFDKP